MEKSLLNTVEKCIGVVGEMADQWIDWPCAFIESDEGLRLMDQCDDLNGYLFDIYGILRRDQTKKAR